VGHVVRGFESFAEECFEALRGRPELEVGLVAGRGRPRDGRLTAPVPAADAAVARALGRAMRRDGYFAQQILFAVALAPILAARRPHVVLVSDWVLASALGRLRALTRLGYKLLLSNGAPGGPRFDWSIDHVQQLTPALHRLALEGGEPPGRHTLLPLGVAIEREPPDRSPLARRRERARLGLPVEGEILLSVAALNAWSKRIDHLADEVAPLEQRPHLVLLGQPEPETPALLRHVRDRLGAGGVTARTVLRADVPAYYRAADMFVLASLHESMGRVLVEALSHGLPVLAHDSHWSRFALADCGWLADLSEPGALAGLVERARAAGDPPGAAEARHRSAYERYAWDRLAPAYVEMVRACAAA
jgi:1,2-diacylglycerol 3-alpha-glucosyltransferase